jgi:hypothetical protein
MLVVRGGKVEADMSHVRTPPGPSRLDADLAAQAALALDNLVICRASDLTAVRNLADSVSAGLQSQATVDPTTAVAMQRALIQAPNAQHSTTVNELLANASEFVQRLVSVADEGQASDEEARWLRTVCVALSRSAVALSGPLYDRVSPPLTY